MLFFLHVSSHLPHLFSGVFIFIRSQLILSYILFYSLLGVYYHELGT